MNHNNYQNKKVKLQFQIWIGIIVILGILGFLQSVKVLKYLGIEFSLHSTWACLLTLVSVGSSLIGISILTLTILCKNDISRTLEWFSRPSPAMQWSLIIAVAACAFGFYAVILYPTFNNIISSTWMRLVFIWWIVTLGTLTLKAWRSSISWLMALTASAIFSLVGVQLLTFVPQVNSYPFSLNWSETSYLYYASLVVSQKLYGFQIPLSTIYPSRDLLNFLPFLFGISNIWGYRLWIVILWIVFTAITSIELARRLKLSDLFVKWLFIGLVFIYFMQGGLKYELQICVIIILIGTSRRHPWRTIFSVGVASFWAGMSRLNWYPVPGVLATTLFLLEEPMQKGQSIFRYFRQPLLWFILGIGIAFCGSAFTGFLTQSPAWGLRFGFGTGIPSLWYRLLPNPTYPLGIIPAIAVFSMPLWWILVSSFYKSSLLRWHFIRMIGLGACILVLFIGGLYVSTKIGGGGDLHNLDAYMVVLVVVASYIGFDRFESDTTISSFKYPSWIAVAFAIPILLNYGMQDLRPLYRYDQYILAQRIETLRTYLYPAAYQGEILFLNERQLIIYGYIPGIPLVPDYELVELQSRANLPDPSYLGRFYTDLKSHRFSMIIAHKLGDTLQGSSHAWGEENDSWVLRVVKPLLCEYKPLFTIPDTNAITLYIPRNHTDCP